MDHLTEAQLNEYLDQALPETERARVEAHLARCGTCRAELASLQAVFAALEGLQPEPMGVDLAPRIVPALATERRRAARWGRLGWGVLALQGAIAGALLALGRSSLATWYVERIPAEGLRVAWERGLARWALFWPTVITGWQALSAGAIADLGDLWADLGQQARSWRSMPGLGFTLWQVVIVVLAATLMWAVGNAILLRATKRP